MKTDKNIFIAFLLNLLFSVVELIGGIFTGSFAIISDALHDFGDATAIAISYGMERKSKHQPDKRYTYGYGRYSVLGGAMNALILLIGSAVVILGAIRKLFYPTEIHTDGMILMAVFGVIVNFLAAYVTHGHGSINQRTVNLHMLEDVLGWIVVLIGAVILRFTGLWFIDPLLSIAVALFILANATKAMTQALDIFLEKAPDTLSVDALHSEIKKLPHVSDVHHIHLWRLNEDTLVATMHIVAHGDAHHIKDAVRQVCTHFGVQHVTVETESPGEHCHETTCCIHPVVHPHCHHHHH